ncbi:Alpha carbonic anhydrase 1, chloroplastic [Ananas comosus]|uniref:Carbonic anhydrase n=1 Tax=Ananas comosus TaxID=4615 RepID=A0A199UHA8_ANACO|nr:Alpha carbonic anhydrase 1, chloroplastic [Ananas comosus]
MAPLYATISSSLVTLTLLVAIANSNAILVKFGYSGANGPDRWGCLSPQFALCSKGTRQSPINIIKNGAVFNPKLRPLKRDYVASNATLVDNGFNIELKFDNAVGNVIVDGKKYWLKQMHWHSPSEHTITGERFPMEIHMVHKSDDGNITVIAIFYKYGHPDPFLFQIKEKLAELNKEARRGDDEAQIPVGVVRTKAFKRCVRKYFRYVGSLTTPPCTENVIWIILGKVREITKEQADALRAPLSKEYKNNSRPIQRLNGRSVELYDAYISKQT